MQTQSVKKRLRQFNEFPCDALLSAKDQVFLSGRSRSSLWRDVQRGGLAKPVRIGPSTVRWRIADVRDFLAGSLPL
jgi:predicted DNA-binding transcriptional regulator AlpA